MKLQETWQIIRPTVLPVLDYAQVLYNRLAHSFFSFSSDTPESRWRSGTNTGKSWDQISSVRLDGQKKLLAICTIYTPLLGNMGGRTRTMLKHGWTVGFIIEAPEHRVEDLLAVNFVLYSVGKWDFSDKKVIKSERIKPHLHTCRIIQNYRYIEYFHCSNVSWIHCAGY